MISIIEEMTTFTAMSPAPKPTLLEHRQLLVLHRPSADA